MAAQPSGLQRAREWLQHCRIAGKEHERRQFDAYVMPDVKILSVEPSHIVCSLQVPSYLTNAYNTLHGGAIATLVDIITTATIFAAGSDNPGVSVDLNVTYMSGASLGDELILDSKVLRIGKSLAMLSMDIKKTDGKLVAQGRHTKYFAAASKL